MNYTVALPENGFNLMREINETSAKSTSGNFTLTGNTTVNITKDLKFVGLASFSYISDHGENINGKNTYAAWMDRPFENNTTTSKRTMVPFIRLRHTIPIICYGDISPMDILSTKYIGSMCWPERRSAGITPRRFLPNVTATTPLRATTRRRFILRAETIRCRLR